MAANEPDNRAFDLADSLRYAIDLISPDGAPAGATAGSVAQRLDVDRNIVNLCTAHLGTSKDSELARQILCLMAPVYEVDTSS